MTAPPNETIPFSEEDRRTVRRLASAARAAAYAQGGVAVLTLSGGCCCGPFVAAIDGRASWSWAAWGLVGVGVLLGAGMLLLQAVLLAPMGRRLDALADGAGALEETLTDVRRVFALDVALSAIVLLLALGALVAALAIVLSSGDALG